MFGCKGLKLKSLKVNWYLKRNSSRLREAYNQAKDKLHCLKEPDDVIEDAVYVCNELNLEKIKAIGFDYDYTLAHYKPLLPTLLYDLGKKCLVSRFNYPEQALFTPYTHDFPIRGLHYDIKEGILFKLNSFSQIVKDSAHKGRRQLTFNEILKIYKHITIPLHHVNYWNRYYLLADIYSLPKICLIAHLIQYFDEQKVDYDPELVYRDVKECIGWAHGQMHRIVSANREKYIEYNKKTRILLEELKCAGKTLFLVTNSGFVFLNNGMNWIIGNDWREFFDLVVVESGKPTFFNDLNRPFRVWDEEKKIHLWKSVTKLEKGVIYKSGNVKFVNDMIGWKPQEVLYFGDHPSTDLADLTLDHGWRTAAVIHELIDEVRSLNRDEFKRNVQWITILAELIDKFKDHTEEEKAIVDEWFEEREEIKKNMKVSINEYFGSTFRTYRVTTLFARRLMRFSDIYMARLTNLLNYNMNHHFLPRKRLMPHETYFNLTN